MTDRSQELTPEQKAVIHAYLLTFGSDLGRTVLDDLRRSYIRKPFDESRFNDLGYLVQRATEINVVLKIERVMQRAAELVQKMEGVEPSHTPNVITDETK